MLPSAMPAAAGMSVMALILTIMERASFDIPLEKHVVSPRASAVLSFSTDFLRGGAQTV